MAARGVFYIAEKIALRVANGSKWLLARLRFVETRTVRAVRADVFDCREFY
jgi:hypothetical protein